VISFVDEMSGSTVNKVVQ